MQRECSVGCCDKPGYAKGLCEGHRARWQHGKRGLDLESPLRWHRQAKVDCCAYLGCSRMVHCKDLCSLHYQRLRHGSDMDLPVRIQRPIDPDRSERDRVLWSRAAISEFEWAQILVMQDGRCALCEVETPPMWHLDHDHSCLVHKGRYCPLCIRGLLCPMCNIELAAIEKWLSRGDVQVNERIMAYLSNRPVLEMRVSTNKLEVV